MVITKIPQKGLSLQELMGCDYNRTSLVLFKLISAGSLAIDKKYLAGTVKELTVYAVCYIFIFGNFDGLSNLMVLKFFNDRDIILDSNLLSNPFLRSSPNLFSN